MFILNKLDLSQNGSEEKKNSFFILQDPTPKNLESLDLVTPSVGNFVLMKAC